MNRKACPLCRESIAHDAKKCPFCGEWVDAHAPQELARKSLSSQSEEQAESSRGISARRVAGLIANGLVLALLLAATAMAAEALINGAGTSQGLKELGPTVFWLLSFRGGHPLVGGDTPVAHACWLGWTVVVFTLFPLCAAFLLRTSKPIGYLGAGTFALALSLLIHQLGEWEIIGEQIRGTTQARTFFYICTVAIVLQLAKTRRRQALLGCALGSLTVWALRGSIDLVRPSDFDALMTTTQEQRLLAWTLLVLISLVFIPATIGMTLLVRRARSLLPTR